MKLNEYIEILNKQSPLEIKNKWKSDRSQPTILVSNIELPIAVDIQEIIHKTDDEVKRFIQRRIISVLDIKLESLSNQTNNSSDQSTPHH